MKYIFLLFSSFFVSLTFAQQPVELGAVNWLRDMSAAQQQSKKTQKPIFILFQEVPGCGTCQRYGNEVLRHPLIVEAIQTCFVPLAIFNNKKGKDLEVLQYYNEPTWNNPVVRIVDHERKNLMPRLSGNYTKLAIVQSMLHVLQKDAPGYLKLLQEELLAQAVGTETTTLSMYCFWSGELKIGAMEGVVATEPGFMHGKEVVQVTYNPIATKYATIVKTANAVSCGDQVFVQDEIQRKEAEKILGKNKVQAAGQFKLDQDRKYYLSKSIYRFVPMTPLQAIRANEKVAYLQSLQNILSPRQLELAEYIKSHPKEKWNNQIGMSFEKTWEAMEEVLH